MNTPPPIGSLVKFTHPDGFSDEEFYPAKFVDNKWVLDMDWLNPRYVTIADHKVGIVVGHCIAPSETSVFINRAVVLLGVEFAALPIKYLTFANQLNP